MFVVFSNHDLFTFVLPHSTIGLLVTISVTALKGVKWQTQLENNTLRKGRSEEREGGEVHVMKKTGRKQRENKKRGKKSHV